MQCRNIIVARDKFLSVCQCNENIIIKARSLFDLKTLKQI